MKVAIAKALAWLLLGASFTAALFVLLGAGETQSTGQDLFPVLEVDVVEEIALKGVSTTLTAETNFTFLPAPASGLLTNEVGPPRRLNADSVWQCGSIDGRAVICAAAPEPIVLWRELAIGTRGEDVLGLQQFLLRRGYLDLEPDGVFGKLTEQAFKEFREQVTGQLYGGVRPGDLLVVGESGLFEATGLQAGQVVGVGEEWARISSEEPSWYVEIPPGSIAEIEIGDLVEGEGFVGEIESFDSVSETSTGQSVARFGVHRTSGGVVGLVELVRIRVTVGDSKLVGRWVPSAAVATDSDGALFVVGSDGENYLVEVLSDSAVDGRVQVADSLEVATVLVPNPALEVPSDG